MSENAAYDWTQKATVAFQKLSPRPGDILTVTLPDTVRPEQIAQIQVYVADVLQDLELDGKVGCMIVVGGLDMQVLRAETMNELGWYRKDDL
jgi:hypothetical protein